MIAALTDVQREMDRQDKVHPAGYPATRDGLRLALAAAGDELTEAYDAWRQGRCKCPTPMCGHHDWSELRVEMLQTAAVILRAVADLDLANASVGRPEE